MNKTILQTCLEIEDNLIIAVDFDGFLFEDEWPSIGLAKIQNIQAARMLKGIGHKLILWTCRTGKQLEEAIVECTKYGIKFDAINSNLPEIIEKYGHDSRKITADLYLDDRAYNNFNQEVL